MNTIRLANLLLIIITLVPHLTSSCYIQAGLTQAQKDALLDKHNQLRSFIASGKQGVQPLAGNMKELVWSDEVAKIAEDYAKTCPTNGHNGNRADTGENIYTYMSSVNTQIDLTQGVQSWFDEVKDFECYWDPSNLYSYKGDPKTGHYTQVVWAETEALGCSSSLFLKDGKYTTVLICNYWTAGNVVGSRVYRGTDFAGYWCKRISNRYPALCGYSNETSHAKGCAIKNEGLSDPKKVQVLNKMNELRNKVASGNQTGQPSATNMLELVWDEDLANLAKYRAGNCSSKPLPNDTFTIISFVAWRGISYKEYSYERAPQLWFDQVNKFNTSKIPSFSNLLEMDHKNKFNMTTISASVSKGDSEETPSISEYSKLMWATAKKVGCGMAIMEVWCMYADLLVCAISPQANIEGLPVYITGPPASMCETKSANYTSLCVTVTKEADKIQQQAEKDLAKALKAAEKAAAKAAKKSANAKFYLKKRKSKALKK